MLFLLPLVLFWAVTVGPYTLIPADILFQYAPWAADAGALGVGKPQNHLLADLVLENWQWKRFMIDSVRAGELPLWNPYLFAGVPFLAAGQHSALYPPSLLYYVLPLEKAYGWYTVLNLAIAGWCMFALLRGYALRHGSALFGAVAFQLSGFFVGQVVFQMMIGAAAWLPLVLLACDGIIERRAPLRAAGWMLLGALALAMVVLAGHIEILVYTLLVAGLYAAHRLFWRWFQRSRALPDLAQLIAPALALLAMVGLGLALAAIQLIPLYELVSVNFRSARTEFAQVLSYGFPKSLGWMRWLLPNFFGSEAQRSYFDVFSWALQTPATNDGYTFWNNGARWKNSVEGAAYVGVLTLVLAVSAAFAALRGGRVSLLRRVDAQSPSLPPTGFFIVLAMLSLAFVFGTPLYAILYYGLPGINQLHSPFRWVFPLTLCLSGLAAIGLQQAMHAAWAQRVGRLCMALAAGALAAVLLLRVVWPLPEPAIARALALLKLDAEGYTSQLFFSIQAVNLLHFCLALGVGGLCLVWLARSGRAWPAVLVLAVDCMAAWWGFNPRADQALLRHVPAPLAFLLQDQSQWRLITLDAGGKPLNANAGWMFGVQDARGYDSIIPKQYVDYMRLIAPQDELPYNRIAPLRKREQLESPLLDLLNVKYVLTEKVVEPPVAGLNKVFEGNGTLIYENTRVLPRAFILPLTAGMLTDDFGFVAQSNDPRKFVMIDASCGVTDIGCLIPRAAEPKPATITSYRNNEVWVDLAINQSSWLILADSYFKGWRAYVRPLGAGQDAEREVDILPANGNFRAVRLDVPAAEIALPGNAAFGNVAQTRPSHAYTVRFKYAPDSVRLGAFVSAIAGVMLVFATAVLIWRVRSTGTASISAGHDDSHAGISLQRVARNSLTLTALSMLARVIDMAFALIMLRYLGPEGNGKFTFAVVLVSWFEILMNFGLNTFLVRDVARDKTHAARYFWRTTLLRLQLALFAAPLVVLVIVAFRGIASLRPEQGITPDTEMTIALLVLSQLPGSLAAGLSALFFAHERAEVPAAFSIVTALVKVVLGAIALVAGAGIVGLAAVSIIGNMVTMIALAAAARHQFGFRFDLAGLRDGQGEAQPHARKTVLRESFPLMINHLLSTIYWQVDVLLLSALRDKTTVGLYRSGYKYVDAFNIIPSLFTQSLFPAMSRMAGKEDASKSFARTYVLAVKLLLALALPLSVSVSFLAEPLITFLGGRAFLPAGAIALAIVIWHMPIGWINSVTNYALIATGQQRLLTRAFIGAVAFNIIANLFAIPLWGYVGAAIVTALSEVAQLITFYVYVRRFIIRVNWLRVLGAPMLAAGLMAVSAGLGALQGAVLPGLLIGIMLYVLCVFALRAFDADELALLAPLVPVKVRARLGLA